MATTSVESPTLSSTEDTAIPSEPAVDKPPTPEAEPGEAEPQSPSQTRQDTNISETDPNAFKITILLAPTGYKIQLSINRSFLEKVSSVDADGFLVSQLKNAIWKDWPSDWPEELPPSPNSLRLIYAGKMLADKNTLSECNIGPGKPNILHLSIRPADFVDDEFESGKKVPGIARRSNVFGCCNCIIS